MLAEPLCDHLADRLGPAFGKTTSCPEAYKRWRDALGQLAIDVTPEPDYDDRIASVLDHLRATPSPPPSIEDLTRIAHLSESRLQHLFRDQVGVPIRRYLLWHRYLTAMSLLADGTSVTHAAHAAGFADSAHEGARAAVAEPRTPARSRARIWAALWRSGCGRWRARKQPCRGVVLSGVEVYGHNSQHRRIQR